LKEKANCQVIAEALDGLEAVRRAEELKPDLILLDIGLPELNGIEAAKRIRNLVPQAKILFMSQDFSPALVQETLRLGALGYIHKISMGSEILPAVNAVLGGTPFVSGRFVNTGGSQLFQHEAQFYSDDTTLVERLADLVHSALKSDSAAVVVATERHRCSLVRKLASLGAESARAQAAGRLVLLDATETLSKIIVDRLPDSDRFSEVIGSVLAKANSSTPPHRSCVTVFGEMVALLWADGHQEATICLEELWNGLASKHHFSLRCAYPVKASHDAENSQLVMSVCPVHSVMHSI
jgi:CheY-like chemotaxis protein